MAITARTRNALICGTAAAAIVAYTPVLFYRPRIMCEEGVVYIASAWQSGFLAELVRPHIGYYHIIMNIAGYAAAHWMPLLWVAAVFTVGGLLVQVLTVYVFLQCEAFCSLSFAQRWLGAFIVLFAAPNLESWVILLNAHFQFLIIAGLLCVSDPRRRVVERTFLVTLAGLTGPLAVSLTPFFWLRAWRERSRAAWAQALLLTCGLTVQLIFVRQALKSGERMVHRQWSMAGGVLLIRDLFMPFFTRLSAKVPSLLLLHHPSPAMFAAATVFAILGFAALFWLTWPNPASRWLLALAIWAALFCIAGSLNPTNELLETGMGPRYSFASNVFIGLAVLLAFSTAQAGGIRRFTTSILLIGLVVSGVSDSAYYRFYKAPPGGNPSWTAGVRAWQKDPSRPILVGGPCTPLWLPPRK